MLPSDRVNNQRPAFTVQDLGVAFRSAEESLQVVARFDLVLRPGRIVGIAGESGSGKTTAVLAAIGYLPGSAVRLSGQATIYDTNLFELDPDGRRAIWARQISYVAQDAAASLNPAFRIGTQLTEILEVNRGLSGVEARARARELLEQVRLPNPELMLRRYPHQCSGGQLQRVAIAMALAGDPRVMVFDEPTTGLDVTTQAEVAQMLSDLIRERQIAAAYISHDLALLSEIADDLVIFYAGEVVEQGPTRQVLDAPRHPYTRNLLDALPSTKRATRPIGLPGLPPGRVVPTACAFAPRCRWVVDECWAVHPDLLAVGATSRRVRCLRADELATELERDRPVDAAALLTTCAAPSPILAIDQITCSYGSGARRVEAVSDVSLTIGAGEVVALVGESGSGKSTIGRAIVGLLPTECGAIAFDGVRLDSAGRRTPEQYRAIQIVFQNPDSSLNPRHTVASLIGRSFELFRPDVTRRQRRDAIATALAEVRLDAAMMDRYPHQLSGGQKQRVAIARAFVARPRLVICDEIVSGQDVSVQAAILELVRSMQERHGTALLFVSHDLAVVRSIAQRVYVIQRGRIVEWGATEQIFDEPEATYTRALLASVMDPTGKAVQPGIIDRTAVQT